MKPSARFAALAVTLVLATSCLDRGRAEDSATGSWSIWQRHGRTELSTTWSDSTGQSTNSDTRDVDATAIGLVAALASSGEHVHFVVHHEAGDCTFEGWVKQGNGGGTYTFAPNQAFFDYLRNRGFAVDSLAQEMNAANMDLTREYVDEMLSLGLQTDYHGLMRFRDLDIEPAYIRDLASVGFVHLAAHDYLRLKELDVDSAYVKYLKAHGFQNLTVREVLRLKSEQI